MKPQKTLIDNETIQAPAASHSSPEIAVLALVHRSSPINMDDLARLTPQFTWNQVFHTIDVLSRQGKIFTPSRSWL